ncbi:MAG: YraN family protein [Chthoniobacterales bacterium]
MAPARFIAALSNRWRSRSSTSPSPERPDTGERGRRGEKLAAKFLRRHGYKILYRNFRGRTGGEIDIVARDGDTLVFVEVKTRGSEEFGRPFETIRRDQQRRISRGALAWLRLLDNPDILFRFDAVEVVMRDEGPTQIELIQNAFTLAQPYIY